MVQLQVFFDNQEVELFKDESIVLTQSIQDIKDIQKVFIPFTQTFNVPASRNNNKIFNHFYNFNILGFDARKKTDAELYLNYKLFKKGKIKLEGVQLKNNEPHTYKLTFFGNTVNLKDLLGETKLNSLIGLQKYKFTYDSTNIGTLMTSGLDFVGLDGTIEDALIIPLITHTARLTFDSNAAVTNTDTIKNINTSAGTSTSYGVPLSEFKPAIRLYSIIKAIESEPSYNIKFSTDFFSRTNKPFFGLYMWLHNKEGALLDNQSAQSQVLNFTPQTGQVDKAGIFGGFGNKSFESRVDEILKSDKYSASKIKQISRHLTVEVTPSGSDPYNLVIKKDGEEFQRFENLTGTTENGQSGNVKLKNGIEIQDGVYTFYIESEAAQNFTFVVGTRVKSTRRLSPHEFYLTGTTSIGVSKELSAVDLMPDMKVIDFLTALFKLYNLTAFEDDNGIVQVKTLDDFYASSTTAHDITEYVDKTETVTDSVLPFHEVDFRFEGTGSFLANNHKQLAAHEWGALYERDKTQTGGTTYDINIPFEHFKYEHLFTSNNKVESTTLSGVQYGYSVDESQSPYLGQPLIFYAANSATNIRALNLAGTAGVTINTPFIPLNCIEKGSTALAGKQSINFNAEFDEFSLEVNPTSLFKTYYETYIKDVFDPRKRLTSLKAYLPMSLIYNLNLADKFILNNNEYRINKISTNFETEQSSLELTNIFETPDFRVLTVVEMNCVTADTTNFSADTIDVRADAGCDNKFTLPNIATGLPQSVDNNPQSVFSDTDLPVTAPTLAELQIPVGTSTEVFFAHQITAAGKIGGKGNIDEYGFLYATTTTNLSSTDDIDTLKTLSGITTVAFTPSLAVANSLIVDNVPIQKVYKKASLTHPASLHYRFYARTNTKATNTKADAISTAQLVSTNASTVSQYNNANGENMVGIIGTTGYISQNNWNVIMRAENFNVYGAEDQTGFALSNNLNPVTEATAKQMVEWFSSVASPAANTYYAISHTFKAINRFGADNSALFNMSNKTNAFVKYILYLGAYPVIMIKGGTVTGTLSSGQDLRLGSVEQDLQSTS
jgi:hypothetical protein